MKPYYQDDWATIYHGDCREVLPGLSRVDLVLTDPPYGKDVAYGDSYNDDRTKYWEWFLPTIPLIRAAGDILVFTHCMDALSHVRGFDWVAVWNKGTACGSRIGNSNVLPQWEPIFLFGIHCLGVHSKFTTDVLECRTERAGNSGGYIGREKWSKGQVAEHPCPKPVSLFTRLITEFGQRGGDILDPFMGSGTTLRAAKDLQRKSIGIEIEERYCEIAAKRLAQEVLAL